MTESPISIRYNLNIGDLYQNLTNTYKSIQSSGKKNKTKQNKINTPPHKLSSIKETFKERM